MTYSRVGGTVGHRWWNRWERAVDAAHNPPHLWQLPGDLRHIRRARTPLLFGSQHPTIPLHRVAVQLPFDQGEGLVHGALASLRGGSPSNTCDGCLDSTHWLLFVIRPVHRLPIPCSPDLHRSLCPAKTWLQHGGWQHVIYFRGRWRYALRGYMALLSLPPTP